MLVTDLAVNNGQETVHVVGAGQQEMEVVEDQLRVPETVWYSTFTSSTFRHKTIHLEPAFHVYNKQGIGGNKTKG